MNILNSIYDAAISNNGSFGESVQALVDEYLERYDDPETAIDELVSNQKLKCTATGFLTGLGGLMTLPLAIPADLASSLIIEIRMIAAIAAIRGFDIDSDAVRTMIILCLVGNSTGDVLKQAGIKALTDYTANTLIPKISKKVSEKIVKSVGNKIVVKSSSKVLPKVAKVVPIIGGVVGGVYNYAEVSAYAKVARERFN